MHLNSPYFFLQAGGLELQHRPGMILLQLSSLLSSTPPQELCSYNMSLKTIMKRCEAHRQVLEVMQDQGFASAEDDNCTGEVVKLTNVEL
jgi:hypothetical protein